ncbi:cyclase family protein [Bacillus suaedaesalsae]|uniref:Cyclase family protein n=1 Tax=Bacillus suaedaesalsae TaxID=2810349 RepID=A0ABS2DH09_9BACI|nr:cyclase family protein [Bacillus suaedaesalsae]MBM6616828.1 cyclase family protein [Bacillus suaedaesalsae]
MKIYDITAPVFVGMPVYKNKPEKQPTFDTVTNGHVTETRISLDVHSGTHMDAPLHMMNDGATIETIDIEKIVGASKVLDLTHVEDGITKKDLEAHDIQKGDFLLFKTKNSFDEEFNFQFIYLKEDGAQYLAELEVRGLAIDALGVERSQEGHPTHKALFSKDIVVIEGVRLKDVPTGNFFMVAAPMKLIGTDASPTRVLLFEDMNI